MFDSMVMSTLSPKPNYPVHKGAGRAAFREARGKMMKKLLCGGFAASLLPDSRLTACSPSGSLIMANCFVCLCVPAYMCVLACAHLCVCVFEL